MPVTITDPSTDQRGRDEQRTYIGQRRAELAATYGDLFARMTAAWNASQPDDCAWLIYSANYLLRTAGVRWAIDPLTLPWRVPEAPAVALRPALDRLDFVLLTHRHADHLDFDLLRALSNLPIRWVIPETLLSEVQAAANLPAGGIIVPQPLQPIDLDGVRILPFKGHHHDEFPPGSGRMHGVPATAYLIEFNGKRWLFPGDTRDYRAALAIDPGLLDGLFAHLWLGRGAALLDEPPLMDDFCCFCLAPRPKRVILTHLEELGRDEDDYWDERHARQVIARCGLIDPEIPVEGVYMGESVRL